MPKIGNFSILGWLGTKNGIMNFRQDYEQKSAVMIIFV